MTFKDATDLLAVPLETVAEVVGREYSTVMAYRMGKREPTPEVRERLAAYMRSHGARVIEAADQVTV